jgi:hypothetical protein
MRGIVLEAFRFRNSESTRLHRVWSLYDLRAIGGRAACDIFNPDFRVHEINLERRTALWY